MYLLLILAVSAYLLNWLHLFSIILNVSAVTILPFFCPLFSNLDKTLKQEIFNIFESDDPSLKLRPK